MNGKSLRGQIAAQEASRPALSGGIGLLAAWYRS